MNQEQNVPETCNRIIDQEKSAFETKVKALEADLNICKQTSASDVSASEKLSSQLRAELDSTINSQQRARQDLEMAKKKLSETDVECQKTTKDLMSQLKDMQLQAEKSTTAARREIEAVRAELNAAKAAAEDELGRVKNELRVARADLEEARRAHNNATERLQVLYLPKQSRISISLV